MASVHEILLRVLGDSEPAERELEELAREINAFDRLEAEADLKLDTSEVVRELEASRRRLADWGRQIATATADLDTGAAQEDLNRMRAQLSLLDLSEADPKVQLQTAAAIAKIDALEVRLARLDATDVEIDVDLRRGITERLAALTGDVGRLVSGVSDIGPAASGAGGGVSDLMTRFGPMSVGGPIGAGILAIVVTLGVTLVGALAAVVASAALAVAALGAVAATAGALLLPAIGLVVGAVQRFSATSDEAGSAASRLQNAAKGIADTFRQALAPAADAVFRGLASAIKTIEPLINSLKPAFTAFGQVAGQAVKTLAEEFASPAWRQFFQTLINGASQVLPPLIAAFISFARIMREIVSATLPFFVSGIRAMAGGMRDLASGAANVDLSGVFSHLGSWLELGKQLSRVLLEFFKAAAPAGQELVNWLARGAQALADWLGSTEGQAAVKQFFTDTVPLAKQLVTAFGQLVVAAIQFGQAVAPILAPIVAGFNQLLGVLRFALGLFNQIPAPIRNIIGLLIQFAGPLGILKLAITNLGAAFNWLLGAAKTAWNAIKNVITNSIQQAKAQLATIWAGIKGAATGAWNAIKGAASSIWNSIKGAITGAIQAAKGAVSSAVGAMKSAASSAWNAIRGAASSIWGAIKGAIQSAINAAKSAVSSAVGAMKSAASAAWNAIKSSASSVLGALKNVVSDAFSAAASAVKSAGSAIVSAAGDIWQRVKDALSDVITINIDIPMPSIPKIDLPGGSLYVPKKVGEGLANLINKGLAKNLGAITPEIATEGVSGLVAARLGVPTLAGVGSTAGSRSQHFYISTPSGGSPDPMVLAAQVALAERQRG